MYKRGLIVAGGVVVGLLLVGGAYELNRLYQDYSQLSLAVDAPSLEAEAEPAERSRKRSRRSAQELEALDAGTDDAAGTAAVTSVGDDGAAQAVDMSGDRRLVATPESLAEARRPDLRTLRRKARLHRRGTRVKGPEGVPTVEKLPLDDLPILEP